jgi:two-component system cell cycle sensor histidine kinase/response regulator CckA
MTGGMKPTDGGTAESLAQRAAHAAHDIINMVMIVLTYADRISRKLDRDSPLHDDVREIRSAAERSGRLIRELLSSARRRAKSPTVLDLHEVLGSVDSVLRGIAGETVLVEMSLGATLARVRGDRADLTQTLMNLALNARDAMPRGGVLTIATLDARSDGPSHAHVELLVRDTGVGMDEATRERVFEPFFTTKTPTAGSGLGLCVVTGVIETMGGAIGVESALGLGTTFRIRRPLVT